MCPHCPRIARQQALSSWLINTLVRLAITGAAVVSSRRIARMPAKRRMASSVYVGAGNLYSKRLFFNFDLKLLITGAYHVREPGAGKQVVIWH
jgi:hypothetical protein